MKKQMLMVLAMLLCVTSMKAEKRLDEFGIFNHLSVGAGVGTTGFGFQVAAPITNFVQMRVGYSFLPANMIKPTFKVDYTHNGGQKDQTDVQMKLNMGDFNFLFDVYPGKNTLFRFTVGAFIGKSNFVKAENTSPIAGVGPGEGLIVGDYLVGTDAAGIARAAIKVNKFKPYVGFGVGRAVPKKRVSVQGDFGVMFWGKPGVYGMDPAENKYVKVTKESVGQDGNKAFKIMSKIICYPVITIRVNGRIF